jgi:hypothetical protein
VHSVAQPVRRVGSAALEGWAPAVVVVERGVGRLVGARVLEQVVVPVPVRALAVLVAATAAVDVGAAEVERLRKGIADIL